MKIILFDNKPAYIFLGETTMKKLFKNLLIWTLIFFVIGFFFIFVISTLEKSSILDPQSGDLILSALAIFIFFFYSFFIGYSYRKKGWLIGLALALIYLVVSIIFKSVNKSLDPVSGTLIGFKSVALLIGAIMGVNKGAKKLAKAN